jgi:hypothetical protein
MAQAQHPMDFNTIWFSQLGSGVRIVGMSFRGETAGAVLVLKNFSQKQVVGFDLVWTSGDDHRLNPHSTVQPKVYVQPQNFAVQLAPAEIFQVETFGIQLPQMAQHAFTRGISSPIFRIGVSHVEYGDGTQQNFNLLNDDQANRSDQPVDFGGVPRRTAAVRGKSVGSPNAASLGQCSPPDIGLRAVSLKLDQTFGQNGTLRRIQDPSGWV